MIRAVLVVVAALSVFACVPNAGTVSPKQYNVQFRPDAAGLAVDPVGKRVDFGRSPKGVIPVLDREIGPHKNLPLSGCPSGVTQQKAWGALILTFSRERFVGWRNNTGRAGRVCSAS